jgi:hypothetical protein
MQVATGGIVLLVVGVFVATASKAGVGWAIVAALASAVAFGIPVSITLATQRRNRSLPLATALPPPPMEQELPMTPAMIDWAQSPVFRKGMGSVTSLVSFVLVLCFAAPAFLSFITILKHRPLGAGAALVWVLFGLLASGLIYGGLRNARLVRRDLARGVYVRWTGPYTTRVIRSGLWSPSYGFVVEAGGRELSSGTGVQHLPPIGFNSGTVDYLPASSTLCEVRNEQGAPLWSLFGTTGDLLGPGSTPPGSGAAPLSGPDPTGVRR